MTEDQDVIINTKGLDKLLKALKTQPPVCRVGILGDKDARTSHGTSNATIGAAHEFGTSELPMRSFLRVPISEKLTKEIESSGALDKDVMRDVIKSGTVVPWLKKIAILAEGIIEGAFASSGYGKWAAWTTPGYDNNTGQILKDTQQLSRSITSEVK